MERALDVVWTVILVNAAVTGVFIVWLDVRVDNLRRDLNLLKAELGDLQDGGGM